MFDPERWDVDELFRRMCRNTVVIAQGAEAAYRTDAVFMPRYDMTPDEKAKYGDTHTMFLSLLEEGFSRLVPAEKEAEYRERLDKEIYILESTDNIDYLLVQYDTVNWARRNGILVGCGRGSAGGCLALYLLGITLIDPVKYGLLFERFLLPERAGLYAACTTRIVGRIDSKDSYRIGWRTAARSCWTAMPGSWYAAATNRSRSMPTNFGKETTSCSTTAIYCLK